VDFRDVDVPMERLCRIAGVEFVPLGIQTCAWCDGTGSVTEEQHRDLRAAAIATFDQFEAAVRDGRIVV
jgi:hypothetical protein